MFINLIIREITKLAKEKKKEAKQANQRYQQQPVGISIPLQPEDIKRLDLYGTHSRLLDECDVESVPDAVLHRKIANANAICVELTLKAALDLYERTGEDVSEMFSQPRVCAEIGGRKFSGESLQPG